MILEGEMPRPLGTSMDWREYELLEDREGAEVEAPFGTSRMLSLRPVVGSVVDFSLGSWAGLKPSMWNWEGV